MNKLLVIILGLLLFSSCTVQQHYHFNEDMSGNYTVEIDVAGMMAMMGNESSIDALLGEINIDSLKDEMNKLEGISGAKIEELNGNIIVGYLFEDIVSLNASLAGQDLGAYLGGTAGEEVENAHITFVKKGKKLYYSAPQLDKGLLEDDEASMGMEMVKWNVKISCASGIKKVKSEDFSLSGNDYIELSTSLTDIINGDVSVQAMMKLR